MELRKLQRTGGSSITITLPKKWIENNNLQDKDLIRITETSSQTLKLTPANSKKQLQRSVLNMDDLTEKMFSRELIAHFLSGVDEIAIRSQRITPEVRNKVREISNFLTGFEIIDETSDEIVLRNIFDLSKFPITKNIEKMILATVSMFQDALKALMENDKLLAQDVIIRDFEVDKLHLIITRQRHSFTQDKITQEEIGLQLEDLLYYEEIAAQLERIADHAVKIAQTVSQTDKKFDKILRVSVSYKTVENKLSDLFEDLFDMVKNHDRKLAHKILDITSEFKTLSLTDIDAELDEMFILNLIEGSFDRVRGYTNNIAEITIDRSVEKDI